MRCFLHIGELELSSCHRPITPTFFASTNTDDLLDMLRAATLDPVAQIPTIVSTLWIHYITTPLVRSFDFTATPKKNVNRHRLITELFVLQPYEFILLTYASCGTGIQVCPLDLILRWSLQKPSFGNRIRLAPLLSAALRWCKSY